MKKILVIGPMPPPTGGMETVMEQIRSMYLKEYQLLIFNTSKNKLIKFLKIFNIINFIYRCIKLVLILLLKKPQIVHIHTASYDSFKQNSIYVKISKALGKKVILHIHGASFKEYYAQSKNKNNIKKTLDSCNSLIVLSDNWKKYYSRICHNKNIIVINNAISNIDHKKYKNLRSKKHYTVLFLSSICKRKGAYDLIKAASQIKDKKIRFFFVGPYENKDKFFFEIDKYGIREKCEFFGEIRGEERLKYFAKADLFVLPSYAEGLPVAVLEAMSFGLPIVSTKVGAIPEVIDIKNGILIKPGDIQSLKNSIISIKENKKKIDYYNNNRLKIESKYTQKTFKNKIEKAYDSIK